MARVLEGLDWVGDVLLNAILLLARLNGLTDWGCYHWLMLDVLGSLTGSLGYNAASEVRYVSALPFVNQLFLCSGTRDHFQRLHDTRSFSFNLGAVMDQICTPKN